MLKPYIMWAVLKPDKIRRYYAGQEPKTEHFTLDMFNCHDANNTRCPEEYWVNLQNLMNDLEDIMMLCGGAQITIVSGYRTPEYNAAIGNTTTNSQHLFGKAADIRVAGYTPAQVFAILETYNYNTGMHQYGTYCHYDIRGYYARW